MIGLQLQLQIRIWNSMFVRLGHCHCGLWILARQQEFYVSILCTLYTIAALASFSSRSCTRVIASSLIGPSIVTERASGDQRLGVLDNTFLSQRFSNWGPDWTTGGKLFCFHELRYAGREATRKQWIVILAQCRFTAIVQKISNCIAVKFKTQFLLLVKCW